MPISKKPLKEESGQHHRTVADEKAIRDVIHKGGGVPSNNAHGEDIAPKNLQLRLYPDQIEAIDHILELKHSQRRRPRQSRHSWLVEAIEEKIERELQSD